MKRLEVLCLLFMIFVFAGGIKTETIEQPTVKQPIVEQKTESMPDCVVCSDSDGEYWLTIIAKRNEIADKEVFSKELIEMVRNNEFKRIMFSYDVNGYPIGLRMNVYLTREDWQDKEKEPYMQISFEQESILNGYNIVEHYDQFILEIN